MGLVYQKKKKIASTITTFFEDFLKSSTYVLYLCIKRRGTNYKVIPRFLFII